MADGLFGSEHGKDKDEQTRTGSNNATNIGIGHLQPCSRLEFLDNACLDCSSPMAILKPFGKELRRHRECLHGMKYRCCHLKHTHHGD